GGFRLGGLLQDRVLKLLEEDLSELDRRVDIELLARLFPDFPFQAPQVPFHSRRHPAQVGDVDRDARRLHAREHGRQRALDLAIDLGELWPSVELCFELRGERDRARGSLREPPVGGGGALGQEVLLLAWEREKASACDARVFVRENPLAEALEGHRLELGTRHAWEEHVMSQADVQHVGGDLFSLPLEKRVERFGVRDRNRAAGQVHSSPTPENFGAVLLGDLDFFSVGESQERPIPAGQERDSHTPFGLQEKIFARFKASSWYLRRRCGLSSDFHGERMKLELDEDL